MSPRVATPLKLAVVASGMTLTELSERSGVSVRSISRLSREPGSTPNRLTARALADALNTSVEALWPETTEQAA